MKTPDVCPVCGASLSSGMTACPSCGSDENTGWRGDGDDPGTDMTVQEYADAVRSEFGHEEKRRFGKEILTALVILLVMAGFVLYMVRG